MQPLRLLRRLRSFKVTEFGTNREHICDFLLVINSNLSHIVHRFRDFRNFQNRYLATPSCVYPPPDKGVARDDLRIFFTERSQTAKVPNGVETFPKISIAWVGCTVHERYRRTDDDIHRTWTFAKNWAKVQLAIRRIFYPSMGSMWAAWPVA